MSIMDEANKVDLFSLWKNFLAARQSLQDARDRVLQTITTIKGISNFQTIASDEEKKLLMDTEAILKATMEVPK